MTIINSVCSEAELALAAYASLAVRVSTRSQIAALREAGMSETQAKDFARRFPTVVAHVEDTSTNFCATGLFRA